MKLEVKLSPGETTEQAEELLEKALRRKKSCSDHEKYVDPALNEFVHSISLKHKSLTEELLKEIALEIVRDFHAN